MCEPQSMMSTLLKKIFQVTTVMNDLTQLMNEDKPAITDRTSDIERYAERFGSNVGKLLRFATEFDPNMYNSFTDEW